MKFAFVPHIRSRAALAALAAALLFVAASPSPAAAQARAWSAAVSGTYAELAPLRSLYLNSVSDARAIARGLDEVERIRAEARVHPGTPLDATLTAYRGALITLRAKHAFWPTAKLRHLNQGLAVLDGVVRAHPDHAEARYLRLMSCYYLPGVLGRGRSVRDDFAALGRLLPGVRHQYPPELYGAIARFVVENGRLPAEQKSALQASLALGDA